MNCADELVIITIFLAFLLTIGKPDISDAIIYKMTGIKTWECDK